MKRPNWSLLLTGVALSLAVPSPAWARAGGGGGGFGGGFGGGGGGAHPYGSSGSGSLSAAVLWVLVPLGLLGLCLMFFPEITRRCSRVRESLTERRLRAVTPTSRGNLALLKARVRECFFPVQESWSSRDMSASRAFVSDALYERHWAKLERMKRRGRANRIKDLVLSDVRVVKIEATDGKVARFAARIEGSARDWVADIRRGVVVAGDPDVKQRFVEYWSFRRDPGHGWVLDEIRRLPWRLPRLPR